MFCCLHWRTWTGFYKQDCCSENVRHALKGFLKNDNSLKMTARELSDGWFITSSSITKTKKKKKSRFTFFIHFCDTCREWRSQIGSDKMFGTTAIHLISCHLSYSILPSNIKKT